MAPLPEIDRRPVNGSMPSARLPAPSCSTS